MGWAETISGDSLKTTYDGVNQDFYRINDTVIYGGDLYKFNLYTGGKDVDVRVIVDGVEQDVSEGDNEYSMGDGSEIIIEFKFNEDAKVEFEFFRYTGTGDCEFPLNEQFSDEADGYDGNWEIVEAGAFLTPSNDTLTVGGDGTASMSCSNFGVENTQVILGADISGGSSDVANIVVTGPSDAEVAFHFLSSGSQVFDERNIDIGSGNKRIELKNYDALLNGGVRGVTVNVAMTEVKYLWVGTYSDLINLSVEGAVLNTVSVGAFIVKAGADGCVYADDGSTNTIKKINRETGAVLATFSPGLGPLNDFDADENGNVYVVPYGSSGEQIRKYNSSGALVWASAVSGIMKCHYNRQESAIYCAVGSVAQGGTKACKINAATGAEVWRSAAIGGVTESAPLAVYSDASGNAYVTMSNPSKVAKFSSSGAALWEQWLVDPYVESVQDIFTDTTGNIYLCGSFAFYKLTSAGELVWMYAHETGANYALGCIGADNRCYITFGYDNPDYGAAIINPNGTLSGFFLPGN